MLSRYRKTQETVAKTANVRRQMKKAFKLLKEVLGWDNAGCVEFVKAKRASNVEKLLLLGKLHGRPGTAVCMSETADRKESRNQTHQQDHHCHCSGEAVNHENLSNYLIEVIVKEGKTKDFKNLIIFGLVGDTTLITNAIWVLKNVLQTFTGALTVDSLRFMLEQILTFMVGNNRSCKILPGPLVTSDLSLIKTPLSQIDPDTKRHCLLLLGYILKRLSKRFGPEEIVKLVPGKQLKNIRKELARAKRKKLE